jgi:hypothetical protein
MKHNTDTTLTRVKERKSAAIIENTNFSPSHSAKE